MYRENRVFKKNGHRCALAEESDLIYKMYSQDTFMNRFMRRMYRSFSINETHPKTITFLKSQMIVYENMLKHLKQPSLIHPFSDFRMWWDFIMIFATFIIMHYHAIGALDYFFDTFDIDRSLSYVVYIVEILLLLNIVVEFRTGYWDKVKQEIVLSKKMITIHYLTGYFLVDLCISIPSEIFEHEEDGKYSAFSVALFLSKTIIIFRIYTAVCNLNMFLELAGVGYALRRIVEMVVYCFIYLHWQACYNVFLINATKINQGNASILVEDWITDKTATPTSTHIWINLMYSRSLVLAGCGTSWQNEQNQFYTFEIFFWILAKAVSIYIITNMMLALKSTRMSVSKNSEMFWHLEAYMRSKGMPAYLRNRLLVFYEFRYQKSFFRESEIMKTVSGQLKQEIIMHNCRKLVENVSFFQGMPLVFLANIMACMSEEVYLPNDLILKVNTTAKCMYFIASGSVAIYSNRGDEIVHLQEGDYFGEIGLIFPDTKRTASVVAVEICELFRLDKRDFERSVHQFPDLFSQIQQIANSRLEHVKILEERDLTVEAKSSTKLPP